VLHDAVPIATGRGGRVVRTDLVGVTPSGVATSWTRSSRVLVLFLSTTCDGCRDLAELVRSGLDGFDVLGVLRTPVDGLPAVAIDEFVGGSGHWLVGDDPFVALDVRSAPFFCIVEGSRVLLEGVAFGTQHVREHCERLLAGTGAPESVRLDAER
jgi:hypothetical protein